MGENIANEATDKGLYAKYTNSSYQRNKQPNQIPKKQTIQSEGGWKT